MASMYNPETSAVQDQQQYQQNPTLLYDALYCSEENWVEEVREDCFQDELEGESYCSNNSNKLNTFPIFLEQDLSWEDEELSSLFAKEEQNQLCKDLETNPSLARARCEAVEWILKVNEHYSFTALTAVLAVNYLDRFLFSVHLQKEKPWMAQLAAVSCLSLAAKVEETQVPLLLDFQVEDSKYVFEAKTIQRMEILVLSTLKWKMNPVTPISFLDYITRRLGLEHYLCLEFLKRCERMVLSILADSRSMPYVPSVMAAATMLYGIDNIEPSLAAEYQSQLLSSLGIDKDKVEDCSKFLMEFALRDHFKLLSNKRKFCSLPGSPSGVVDVSFSSDSSNDSWSVASSVSSSPKPLSKKSRALQSLNNATTSDFLSIPR
ncbi:LOW QUALITY PROTEIN: cyclin-D3-1 [Populus trichocarpa]|uniref:LOW QUALITY PROTEIN: cyclin-D3-1 n=1 Tax=Populus trichocarpa TaxID=3694 RepID=UPI0022795903|nr:LOW QUALITY PROTEIN: cyclin-D3-1 [Populus trichocarpa]